MSRTIQRVIIRSARSCSTWNNVMCLAFFPFCCFVRFVSFFYPPLYTRVVSLLRCIQSICFFLIHLRLTIGNSPSKHKQLIFFRYFAAYFIWLVKTKRWSNCCCCLLLLAVNRRRSSLLLYKKSFFMASFGFSQWRCAVCWIVATLWSLN